MTQGEDIIIIIGRATYNIYIEQWIGDEQYLDMLIERINAAERKKD